MKIDEYLIMSYYNFGFQNSSGSFPTVLFRDNFTNALTTIVSDTREADPTGAWDIVNTYRTLNTGLGTLEVSGTDGTIYRENYLITQSQYTPSAGFVSKVTLTPQETAFLHYITLNNDAFNDSAAAFRIQNEEIKPVFNSNYTSASTAPAMGTCVNGTRTTISMVWIASDFVAFVQDGNIIGVMPEQSISDVNYSLDVRSGDVNYHQCLIGNLAGNWATNYGIADYHKADNFTTSTTSFTHSADFVIGVNMVTLPTSSQINIFFRQQDASNYWRVSIYSTGVVAIAEVVAGTPTFRSTSGAVGADGQYIQIHAVDEQIDVYVDGSLECTYASAANFKTETSGAVNNVASIGGEFNDFVALPYTLGTTEANELDDPTTVLFQDDFYREADNLGEWNVVDPNEPFSISGGTLNLDLATAASSVSANHLQSASNLSVIAGLFVKANAIFDNSSGNNRWQILLAREGFASGSRITGIQHHSSNISGLVTTNNPNGIPARVPIWTFADSTEYNVGFVMVSSNLTAMVLRSGNDWNILGVYPIQQTLNSDARLIINTNESDQTQLINRIVTAQLTGDWATDYGIATDRLAGSVSAGTTFIHEADCNLSWVVTNPPSSGSYIVRFRYQDTDNHWRIIVTTSGTLRLTEFVAGVATTRATGATVMTGGEFVQIVIEDENIIGYVNGSQEWAYASASNFKTETDGDVWTLGTDGALDDFTALPYTLSSALAGQLSYI